MLSVHSHRIEHISYWMEMLEKQINAMVDLSQMPYAFEEASSYMFKEKEIIRLHTKVFNLATAYNPLTSV
jgi:hypothetical protein